MTFRTIDENATNNINKYGIRNSSFADIANAYNAGGIKGVGNSLSSFITSKDLSNIKEFNRLVSEEGVSSQTAWYKTMQTSSSAAKELFDNEENLIKSGNSVILSEETISNATNTMTFSAKAGQVALKGLALAGNMVVGILVGFVISEAIEGLDNLVHAADNAKESAESFSNSFSSMNNEFNSNDSKLSDLQKKYDELSKGVNSLGENVSLTTDEYDEYKQVVSEISDMMPSLLARYDDEGNKIGFVQGKLSDLNAEYDKYKKNKAMDLVNGENDNGDSIKDVFDNYQYQTAHIDANGNAVGKRKLIGSSNYEKIGQLQAEINSGYDGVFGQNKLTNADIEKKTALIQKYQSEIDASVSAIQDALSAIAQSGDEYYKLSDQEQQFLDTYINSLSQDFIDKNNLANEINARTFINNLINDIESGKPEIMKAYDDLFSFNIDDTDLSPEEIQKKVNELIQQLAKALGEDNWQDLKIRLGFGFVDDNVKDYEDTINRFKDSDKIKQFFNTEGINTSDEVKQFNDLTKGINDADKAIQTWNEHKKEVNETPTSFSTLFDGSDFGDRISYLSQQFQNGKISAHDYFQSIRDELANTDFSEFTDQAAAAQQFFTDSTQQVASGMSDLINSYNKGEISATEYLDGYTSMAETLSALTDDLQNNSAAWNENGEAISDGTNQALDNAQSDLASAIEGINQYQDSIYSLEQITSGAITAGSDEFTAHAQVIAEDLAYIVQNGGYMADQIASTMGTTTSEIANSLTNSVDNQALASQAIAGNTNASIEQMANAVSTLFAELGNQIGNFKATINFAPKVNGVEHFSAIKIGGKEIVGGDIPNLTYDIKGSSSSLKSIGSAISSFGKVLSSNIAAQKVDYKKFSTTPTDSSGKQRSYTPSKGVTNNYNNKLKNNKSSGKSGSGGSGGDAEKQNEEYLDKFMAYQKARLEAGKITYQQYSQYVSDELERMYKNGEISASKYYSAVKDMIDEQKSIYDAALKGVIKLLDDEIDKWQDKIDAIEKSNDKLNEQKDKYDSILSAIQKVYDDEIEKANKRKDSIQDIIDAMSDENDEYERQKKLQEAIYNLNKANSQKTKYLLKDGQFVYSTDNSAIRDAQDSLHDAQYDVDVANLKKQQDDIDNYIDTLNEFKDKWNEISDAFSDAQDTMNLKQYLGSEYQRIILSNNLADIENFKNQYVAIESQINSNEQLKTSYEEKVDYYNNLKQQWEDCTSKYDDEMNKLYASQILGANWESEVLSGRLQTLTNFTSEYEKLCQRQADAAVNAANTEVQASKNAAAGVTSTSSSVASSGGGSSSSTSSAPKVTYDKNNNPNKPVQKSNDYWTYEKLSKGYSTSGQASSHISDYASKGANGFTQIGNKYFIVKWIANAGTPANASKAKNKLEKDHPKKIGKYGYAKRYHKGLELGKIEALPKDKAFDLVQDVGTNGLEADEVPIIAQKGEAVLTEEQIENLAKTLHLVPVQNELMEKMSKISLGDLPMNTPKMNFDASKVGQSVTKNNFAPSVTLNLNCPNVSSVSDAKAITDVVDKQLNKFANDFYQASLHYVNKK